MNKNKWSSVKLETIADVIDSLHQTPVYSDAGYPMIRVTDIKKGRLDLSNTFKVAKEVFEKFSKNHLPKKGDLVFSRVGSYGNISYVDTNDDFCLGQNTAFIIPKQSSLFLYYFLNSPLGINEIESSVAGSTQPTVSLKSIKNFEIPLPPLPEQKAIASVLSSLDDKIDLLHRQNKTLEAMAETLFRQWFVVESEKDWEEKLLGDFFETSSGKGLRKEQLIEDGLYPVLGANGEIGRTNDFLFDEKLLFTGRVGTLGNIFIVDNKKVWLSDNTLVFRKIQYFYFVYFTLKLTRLADYNAGSTQPLIRQSDIKEIPILSPINTKLDIFEEQAESFFMKIKSNNNQICTLEALRDTLIPKLMSGKVRVDYP